MTWLLMAVAVIGACWIALVMMQRIADTQQKLARLHDDLRRNDIELQRRMQSLTEKEAADESTLNGDAPGDKENIS